MKADCHRKEPHRIETKKYDFGKTFPIFTFFKLLEIWNFDKLSILSELRYFFCENFDTLKKGFEACRYNAVTQNFIVQK